MKYMKNPLLALCVLAFIPCLGICSSVFTAHVLQVGVYDNGNIYIALDQTLDEPGCSSSYLEIPPSVLGYKQILATAQLAYATGKSITIKTGTCYMGSPSFVGDRTGFIVLKNQ